MDLDHFIDYWVACGKISFNLKDFFSYFYDVRFKKAYLFLHSIELIPLILFFGNFFLADTFTYAILLGFTVHMIADHIGNKLKPFTYFLAYRIYRKFDASYFLYEGMS